MILSVFVSLCDGCKPSEQRVSLDPRCNFFTQCYKGCSANSMASSHPFPELTGEPQSRSHLVNVIFNFGNILLFMCCFSLLTQLSRLVHFLSVVYCSALIVQLSGLVHFLSVVLLGCTFPLLLCQATSWHPSGSQGSPSERRSNIRGSMFCSSCCI